MHEHLLTVEEAAERLRFSAATVRRMLRDKELPGVKLGKREWRVPAKALEEYIQKALEAGGCGVYQELWRGKGLARRSLLLAVAFAAGRISDLEGVLSFIDRFAGKPAALKVAVGDSFSINGNVRLAMRVSGGFDSSGVGTPTVIMKPATAIPAAAWVQTWGVPVAIARLRWTQKKIPKARRAWVPRLRWTRKKFPKAQGAWFPRLALKQNPKPLAE